MGEGCGVPEENLELMFEIQEFFRDRPPLSVVVLSWPVLLSRVGRFVAGLDGIVAMEPPSSETAAADGVAVAVPADGCDRGIDGPATIASLSGSCVGV